MPAESRIQRLDRVQRLLAGLRRTYPDAHCELNYASPLELLIATILSAQCTDRQVNRVTAPLFAKYRSVADYASAPVAELESDLRSLGFFRNKARSVKACCQALIDRHDGRVPASLDALVQLQGVGRKTANVVLGNAFDLNVGVVVDTHVGRLAGRLGLTRETDPVKIERDLMALVPQAEWTMFSHWLIWHGRRRCSARKPDCDGCELRADCPASSRAQGARRAVRTRGASPAPKRQA
jgi:endonuclease-3